MIHDNYSEQSTKAKVLKVANCRGKKPVLKTIEKARNMLQDLMIEINPCEGKEALKEVDSILKEILRDNV